MEGLKGHRLAKERKEELGNGGMKGPLWGACKDGGTEGMAEGRDFEEHGETEGGRKL